MRAKRTEYASADKNLVAYLHSKGHRWHRHKLSGNIVTFRFPLSPDLEYDVSRFPKSREYNYAQSLTLVWEVIKVTRRGADEF